MTGLSTSGNFVKYFLYLFNFLFAITGIIILSIGVAVHGAFYGYSHFLDGKFFSLPSFLIAIGVIIFIVAIFGCVGAVKENYCMTLTFSGFLVIIFIFELSAGISGYVLRNETKDLLSQSLKNNMQYYKTDNVVSTLWDEIQKDFNCCGVTNATDWSGVKNMTGLPLSCCIIPPGATNTFTCDDKSETIRPDGCLNAFGNFIKAHALSLGAAGISIAVVQFVGIFLVCYLAKQIKLRNGHTGF